MLFVFFSFDFTLNPQITCHACTASSLDLHNSLHLHFRSRRRRRCLTNLAFTCYSVDLFLFSRGVGFSNCTSSPSSALSCSGGLHDRKDANFHLQILRWELRLRFFFTFSQSLGDFTLRRVKFRF